MREPLEGEDPDAVPQAASPRPPSTPGGTSLALRPAPDGMPDPDLHPPVVAESGDPFAALRIVALLARLERGRPVRLGHLVDALNASYLDWLFTPQVVADAILQLQANWMTDYRNASGILVDEDERGATVMIEDTSRVDPWLVRQAQRSAAACQERLLEFSRRDRPAGDG